MLQRLRARAFIAVSVLLMTRLKQQVEKKVIEVDELF